MIVINQKGQIQFYNPACEKIFGYERENVLGKNVDMLMPEPHHSEHDTYLRNYRQTASPKIIGKGRRLQGKSKNGEIFPMYLSVGEVLTGNETKYVGVIRDLREEQARHDAFQNLLEKHFLLSRLATMDQMGNVIAHEINQPLSAILTYLETQKLILQNQEEINLQDLANIVDKSLVEANKAKRIMTQLRQYMGTEKGEIEPTHMAVLCEQAINFVQHTASCDNIRIETKIAPDLPAININLVQIQQVLINLLQNACEAVQGFDEKSIRIEIEQTPDNLMKVGVIDNGEGLDDIDLDWVFDPFTTTKEKGLGIGLSISASIINNLQGLLWPEHNHPRGAKFYFTVPLESKHGP